MESNDISQYSETEVFHYSMAFDEFEKPKGTDLSQGSIKDDIEAIGAFMSAAHQ